VNKKDLIREVVALQEEIDRLIMEYRPEHWLSLNLTIGQLKSLVFISVNNQANFRELANALEVTPSVVTGIVDRLVAQEMVLRIDNPVDRRMQWLRVTEKGKKILDDIRQKATNELARILQYLSDEDLAAMSQGFSAFIRAAESHIEPSGKKVVRAEDRVTESTVNL